MPPRQPLLSVIIPSIGRPSLARALDSLDRQPESAEMEVIVVGDTLDHPLPRTEAEVLRRGARYRYLAHAGERHLVGQPQRNAGMAIARGKWLVFGADDNIWTEHAFAAIVGAIEASPTAIPLLFKVRCAAGFVVWREPAVRLGNLDADCIVAPNEPERLGAWGMRYEGDFDFISGTIERHGGTARFCDDLVSLARPRPDEDWTAAL